MKAIILATVAAAALAFSAGSALAGPDSASKGFETDKGVDIYRPVIRRAAPPSVVARRAFTGYAPHRRAGTYQQGMTEEAIQTKEFRAAQTQAAPPPGTIVRHFLTGYAPHRRAGAYQQGMTSEAIQTREFRRAQTWDR